MNERHRVTPNAAKQLDDAQLQHVFIGAAQARASRVDERRAGRSGAVAACIALPAKLAWVRVWVRMKVEDEDDGEGGGEGEGEGGGEGEGEGRGRGRGRG